ncbi:MAG: hypothetical protein CR997_10705 [Acidobacteria bacterium]|nr:MAG: hypothetical protein CR997_10705 [Acidobacteriota bacterium]
MKKISIILIITSLIPAFAQVGTIKGKITNSAGEAIVAAKLVFTEEETTTFEQTLESKEDGSFIMTGLKPGHTYTITVDKEGYNTQLFKYKQWIGVNKEIVEISMETIEEATKRLYEEQGIDPEQVEYDIAAREHYNAAVTSYKAKDYPTALTEMEQSYEKYNLIVEEEAKAELISIPRFYAIVAYFNQKLELSKELCELYLAMKPDDKNILKLQETVAREIAGTSAQNLYNNAIDLINNNDDAGATKLLKQIIENDPEFGLAYFQMGKIKTREFEFEEAVKYYKQFLKVDPNHKLAAEAKELIVTLSE